MEYYSEIKRNKQLKQEIWCQKLGIKGKVDYKEELGNFWGWQNSSVSWLYRLLHGCIDLPELIELYTIKGEFYYM